MAKCPSCGAEIGAENTECPECGANLAEPTASFKPVDVAPAEVKKTSAPAAEGPVLIVRKGPQPGEKFYVDRERLTVGRDPESDIFLNDMTVSRTHAIIECKDNVVTVKDAGSLNGTYVNGDIVESASLKDGDAVQIGTFQMVYCAGGAA
jgi:hypothetical protein